MSEPFHDPGFRLDSDASPTHPAIKVLAALMGVAFLLVFGLPYIQATLSPPPRPHDVPSHVTHGPGRAGLPRPEMDHRAFRHARPPA